MCLKGGCNFMSALDRLSNFTTLIKISILLLIFAGGARAQSTVVDQLAATVNGEGITQSDILWGIVLDPDVADVNSDPQNMNQMLNQLIDQSLLFNEAEQLPNLEPTSAEINNAIGNLIRRFPSEAAFYERISRAGITGGILKDVMHRRLQILKYIDFRFRSFAIITEEEIQQYYKETLVLQLRARGVTPAEQPADQERNMIESILIEDRIDREIERFLENSRRQADIVVLAKY
jgi:hypothetical protein